MSLPFCDNPTCRLHSVKIEGPEFNAVNYVEANGRRVYSERRLIRVTERNTIFALCTICAYAVAMVNEPPELSKDLRASAPLSPLAGTPQGDAKPEGLSTA